jgi:hypothetical protein
MAPPYEPRHTRHPSEPASTPTTPPPRLRTRTLQRTPHRSHLSRECRRGREASGNQLDDTDAGGGGQRLRGGPPADLIDAITPGDRTWPHPAIRPGEGGYNEALAEWEGEQHPDRPEAVSTASGREQAMAVVHAVAEDPDHVSEAVDALDDPTACAEALRRVLVGGTPSVEAFAGEVAGARPV